MKKNKSLNNIILVSIIILALDSLILMKLDDAGLAFNWGVLEYIRFVFVSIIPILILIRICVFFKNKFIRIIVAIIGGFMYIKIVPIVAVFIFYPSWEYHEFQSPKNENTLVIKQNAGFLCCEIEFLKKENPFILRKLPGGILIDDSYSGVTSEDYEMKWLDEETVEFTVGSGKNTGGTKKISLKYKKE